MNTRFSWAAFLFTTTLILSSCGGEPSASSADPDASGSVTKPPPSTAPAVVPAPDVSVAEPEVPPAAPKAGGGETETGPLTAEPKVGTHESLVGSAWSIGDFHIEFRSEEKVFVRGGALSQFFPTGTETKYTIAGGEVAISVMGVTKKAQWDGKKLLVDGMPAVRQETAPPA